MKMTPKHYKRLETEINTVINETGLKLENCKNAMCYRWLLYSSVQDKCHYSLGRELYQYLNDNHIDTALRKITGTNQKGRVNYE